MVGWRTRRRGWLSSAGVRATAVPDAAVSHGHWGCQAVELLGISPVIEAPGHRYNTPASLLKWLSQVRTLPGDQR